MANLFSLNTKKNDKLLSIHALYKTNGKLVHAIQNKNGNRLPIHTQYKWQNFNPVVVTLYTLRYFIRLMLIAQDQLRNNSAPVHGSWIYSTLASVDHIKAPIHNRTLSHDRQTKTSSSDSLFCLMGI